MFLVIVGPHDSHHAVLSLSLFFFFLSFLSSSFVGFLTILCEPAIHFAVSSFLSPHARFLAPLPPVFFPLVLCDANDRWLSAWCAVFGGGGRVSVLHTTLLFFQSGHIVTVNSGPAGVLFLILELSQFC